MKLFLFNIYAHQSLILYAILNSWHIFYQLQDLPRVHAAYEQALVEMAESMYISRNMVVALLALHSWKSFVSNWMQAVIACLDTKESSKLNKASKAADDIFKV